MGSSRRAGGSRRPQPRQRPHSAAELSYQGAPLTASELGSRRPLSAAITNYLASDDTVTTPAEQASDPVSENQEQNEDEPQEEQEEEPEEEPEPEDELTRLERQERTHQRLLADVSTNFDDFARFAKSRQQRRRSWMGSAGRVRSRDSRPMSGEQKMRAMRREEGKLRRISCAVGGWRAYTT